MANDKAFKVKNGLQAGRYLLSNGVETAGTIGYSLANAVYDSVSFSVASQETTPTGIFFKSDGTKMYVVGATGDDVNEYNLSTAWNVSTSTYVQNFSVASQDTGPTDVFFKDDGTKMYIVGSVAGAVYEYSLSTAWNISTASYVQVFSVSSQETSPNGIFFKSDGTKMYVIGGTGDDVNEYTLSTPWNISTSSYVQVFSVASQESNPQGIFFKPDGTKMYIVGIVGDAVNEYTLSTAWDISTASYIQNFSVASQELSPQSLFFKDDGTKMYIVGVGNDTVYQYSTVANTQTLDLSTGTTFSLTPSGATTVSFTNPPASGVACAFTLEVNNNGSAITWPSSVKWHKATTPTSSSTKELYAFITTDGGTKYYGRKAAEELL
jgi:hypothetical protein